MNQLSLPIATAHPPISYRVSLHEGVGETEVIFYDCSAEDPTRAQELAEKAYPGCVVLSCWIKD